MCVCVCACVRVCEHMGWHSDSEGVSSCNSDSDVFPNIFQD